LKERTVKRSEGLYESGIGKCRSFDKPKKPLTHKQIFLPVTFNGIRLILMATPTTYLRT
jgi:hypothetical protein